MKKLDFKLIAKDPCGARFGKMTLRGITIETPVFMPVGTCGSVKSLDSTDLRDTLGAGIILGNTYHLYLRPGHERIADFGGLHSFMGWDGAILTDSGGYQVFSLSKRRKISEEGVKFSSHIDGSSHIITPEKSIRIQESLRSDIIMAFDECPPPGVEPSVIQESMALTTRWLDRCISAQSPDSDGFLFGIVQGGHFSELRKIHAGQLCERELPGYAIGGLSVGEEKNLMWEMSEFTADLLPENKPRYLMGVGFPDDLVICMGHGIDMFDCVLPTRCARNSLVFSRSGRMNLRNARFADDRLPIDPECACPVCARYSRGYIRHLMVSGEITAHRLASLHNLFFYFQLVSDARIAIRQGKYKEFAKSFLDRWKGGSICDRPER